VLSAVIDAESIIGLSKSGVFHLLQSVFSPLYVPAAVVQEVLRGGPNRAGVAELTQALGKWLTEVAPDPIRVGQFAAPRSLADREVLAVAHDHAPIDHVITSDGPLNRIASRLGFACLTAVEVVLVLKRCQLIAEVRPVLDLMKQSGYGIDSLRYQDALRLAGEASSP
jgi:predicted nucleic acid-binding protein